MRLRAWLAMSAADGGSVSGDLEEELGSAVGGGEDLEATQKSLEDYEPAPHSDEESHASYDDGLEDVNFSPECCQCKEDIIEDSDRLCVFGCWYHRVQCLGPKIWFERLARTKGFAEVIEVMKSTEISLYQWAMFDLTETLKAVGKKQSLVHDAHKRGAAHREVALEMLARLADFISLVIIKIKKIKKHKH